MLMTSFRKGGMITRMACEKIMRRIVIHHDMPSAVDASAPTFGHRTYSRPDDFGHVRGLIETEADDRHDEVELNRSSP